MKAFTVSLLLISLAATIAYAQAEPRAHHHENLLKELNLEEKTETQVRAIMKDTHEQNRLIMENARKQASAVRDVAYDEIVVLLSKEEQAIFDAHRQKMKSSKSKNQKHCAEQ